MKIVNGYVCDCSDDARLARRGIDPANPQSDPVRQAELDARRGVLDPKALEEAKSADFDPNRSNGPAVTFGGSLAGETRTGDSTSPAALIDRLA